MNKKSTIKFKDHIFSPHNNKKVFNKNKLVASKLLSDIYDNLDFKKNVFHVFSKKYKFDFKTKDLKSHNHLKTVVIIGMGGSVLGAKAIYSFLKHKIKKNFIFFDNLEEVKIKDFLKMQNGKKTLLIIISKSGNTIETLVNLSLMKKFKFSKTNTIIITENKNSALKNFADKYKIPFIAHKSYLGGRYSVLSEVGMIPALFMNLNINLFKKNFFRCFKKDTIIKNASKTAQIHLSRKINSLVLFNYCPELNEFAFWYQQLIGESLGKNNKGLMPIVSTAPKDHHSLLQLYLDGPKDKFFYVLSSKVKKSPNTKKSLFGKNFNYLQNKRLNKIVLSQKKAFTTVLSRQNIPYREIEINQFNEETLGELICSSILETVLIGKLMKVNPFDQPAVEQVKSLTKKYLS